MTTRANCPPDMDAEAEPACLAVDGLGAVLSELYTRHGKLAWIDGGSPAEHRRALAALARRVRLSSSALAAVDQLAAGHWRLAAWIVVTADGDGLGLAVWRLADDRILASWQAPDCPDPFQLRFAGKLDPLGND